MLQSFWIHNAVTYYPWPFFTTKSFGWTHVRRCSSVRLTDRVSLFVCDSGVLCPRTWMHMHSHKHPQIYVVIGVEEWVHLIACTYKTEQYILWSLLQGWSAVVQHWQHVDQTLQFARAYSCALFYCFPLRALSIPRNASANTLPFDAAHVMH